MPTSASYEQNIVNRLRMMDPQLATGLGTPVRKIIEAVALEMGGYDADAEATTSLYSLDAVSGTELDYLVGQFGFTRQEARAARGYVRFSRDNGDSVLSIPYGSQFYKPATTSAQAVVFSTTAYQELAEGVLSADVPVVATVAGASGNVAADTVVRSSGFSGYISVTNQQAMTGGRDQETDEDLRERFLATVFRNEASTEDQYLGLARAHADVSRANLVGQSSRYSETVQVVAGSGIETRATVTSDRFDADVAEVLNTRRRWWATLTDSSSKLGQGEYLVDEDGKGCTFRQGRALETLGPVTIPGTLPLSRRGVEILTVESSASDKIQQGQDYTLDEAAGTITIPSSSILEPGSSLSVTYDYQPVPAGTYATIEFDYLSKHNRGRLKTVELFVDGKKDVRVTDVQYVDYGKVLGGDGYPAEWWVREDGTHPAEGHIVVPLAYQPMTIDMGSVNAGVATILEKGRHYLPIWDATLDRGSTHGMDAIELLGTVGEGGEFAFEQDDTTELADETPLSIPYYQNGAVAAVQELIDDQSVVTCDALVHYAVERHFGVYLTLMYTVYPRSNVIDTVQTTLVDWAGRQPFGTVLQWSDIETVAANLSGVDNVHVAHEEDAQGAKTPGSSTVGAWGIVEYEMDGETVRKQWTNDIPLAQNEIPVFDFVTVYSQTQKIWQA